MFENVADLGDKIRAYDFAQFGEKASFIEGTVVDKGSCDDKYYACYKIKLTSQHEVQSSKHYTNGVLGAASPPRSLAAPCISADS